MKKTRLLKLAQVGEECVACGSCMKVCPRDAIKVHHGIAAYATPDRCIGCGLCTHICPADVITLVDRKS